MNGVGATTQRPVSAAETTHHPRAESPSSAALLSSPTSFTAAGVNDAVMLLYSAMVGDGSADMGIAKAGIALDQKQRATDRRCVSEALDRERLAEGDGSRGLFGSITHAMADLATNVVDGRVADAASDFGDDASAAWSSPHLWQDLETAATWVATVANVVANVAPTAEVKVVCMAVSGGSLEVAAGAHVRNGHFEAEAGRARADATDARHSISRSERATRDRLDELQEIHDDGARTDQAVHAIVESNDEASEALASYRVRA